MKKKILIIGGGISGLTAGIYARKAGFEAEIYEQHRVAGGECTGWNRQGFHIDNCIHWMMGTTPGSELYRIWETVGAVGSGIQIHKADSMYTSELNGQQITLWKDLDRTEKELLELSPEDAAEIKDLIKSCRMAQKVQIPAKMPPEQIGPVEGIKMLFTMGSALKLLKKYEGTDTRDLMNRFSHPLIRCMISDFCTAESLANSFPMAYGNFAGGDGGIPKGGSFAMTQRMRKTFEKLGGRIFTGKKVERILLESGSQKEELCAAGILLEDQTRVLGDYVVPACDLSVTFGKLLSKDNMSPFLKEVFQNRKAYPIYSAFQTAFALESGENLIGREAVLDCSGLELSPPVGNRLTVKVYDYEPEFAPEGRQIVQTLMGGPEELYEVWKELYRDQEAYRQKKAELAGKIQGFLEERFPACKGKLTLLDAWTPMTYERYMSAYKGFYQSYTITKMSAKQPYPSAFVEGISHLVLAGQWLNPPGGLPGAAIAGKFAVQRIQKLEAEGK